MTPRRTATWKSGARCARDRPEQALVAGEDEYRVRVELTQPTQLLKALRQAQVEQSERAALGRVVVTSEGEHIFLYADSSQSAGAIRDAVQRAMDEHGIDGTCALAVASAWRSAGRTPPRRCPPTPPNARPSTNAGSRTRTRRSDQSRLRRNGRSGSAAQPRRRPRSFAERLQSEGIPVTRAGGI